MDFIKSKEFTCVGAGIGGGFQNTKELHIMKYKASMQTQDRNNWEDAVEEKRKKIEKYSVWTTTKLKDVPKGTRVITSTWAMKKNASRTYRARLNTRGFHQVEGAHYDTEDIASLVTNDMSIRIVIVTTVMTGWITNIIDVKGAFLHGEFDEGTEPVYMAGPEGFEDIYDDEVVFKLLETIYGLKNAEKEFWKDLLKAFSAIKCTRSNEDPYMYYSWTAIGLLIWLSWIDDCASFGN